MYLKARAINQFALNETIKSRELSLSSWDNKKKFRRPPRGNTTYSSTVAVQLRGYDDPPRIIFRTVRPKVAT